MLDKLKRWSGRHPYWLLTIITLATLMPFLAKPFNIDDPLFLWAAKQIQTHPLNPYGFNVEWGWTEFPMSKVTENPPLTCYFIALTTAIFGWGEITLHLTFLLPALALILGTYRLAKNFCARPLLPALITLFAPVVMVSSLTVMCDVPMLAFWIWAVAFWLEGTEQNKFKKMVLAGILISCAEMTKYYGACLVPLLAAYSLAGRQPVRRWGLFLLIPLAILCIYQLVTQALYDSSLLFRAMDYAAFSKNLFSFSKFQNDLIALSFTGGCAASAVFFAPLLWRKRGWFALVGSMILLMSITFSYATLWQKYGALQGPNLTSAKIQMALWATGGLCVLALAVADLFRQRQAGSFLLFLWVIGTFAFAAFCNWTVNARSLLPLVPAVAILAAQRLEKNQEVKDPAAAKPWPVGIILCLLIGYGLAWAVTLSDFSIASASRQSAEEICDKYNDGKQTLWFQGHWGFQYYMSELGASAMDFKKPLLKPGDLLAVPLDNSNTQMPDPQKSVLLETFSIPGAQGLATWNPNIGGGFYASVIAPLPFAFGFMPPQKVFVYGLKYPPGKLPGN